MAKLPPLQRLVSEDYPDQAAWIGKLLAPLNTFMEQTVSALNKNLTITDNGAGAYITVELDGTFPLKVRWPLVSKPISVIVGQTTRSDGASFTLASAVQVQWSFNQAGQLQIDGVVGITPAAATRYKLVLECKAG